MFDGLVSCSVVESSLRLLACRGRTASLLRQAGRITEKLGVPFYFPAPHAPWQRGSNENTNDLLREYFPKGHDLKQDADADVQQSADELNHRPRKCLGWRTLFEAFYRRVLHLV
nr:IS30 family transposase [Sporolactobacillus terrae]